MTYRSDMTDKIKLNEHLKLESNDKKLIVCKQNQAVSNKPFFILGIEDHVDWIATKSISIDQARSLVAYLNAWIILEEEQ